MLKLSVQSWGWSLQSFPVQLPITRLLPELLFLGPDLTSDFLVKALIHCQTQSDNPISYTVRDFIGPLNWFLLATDGMCDFACPFHWLPLGTDRIVRLSRPYRLTFPWWGCCGYVFDIIQPSSHTPVYSVLVSVSVFMALSTVFHSINSPDYSPFFWLCSSGLISTLLILSTLLSLYESLLHPCCNP